MGTGMPFGPPIKIGGKLRPQGEGPHDDLEVRVAYGLCNLPTQVHRVDRVKLREMRLTDVDGHWRLLLKGKKGKQHKVAYFYAPTWLDLIVLAVTMVDSGHTAWYDDDYPPR